MSRILVLVDHDRGSLAPEAGEPFTLASRLASSGDVEAVLVGKPAASLVSWAASRGATRAHLVDHPLLDDYSPETWAEALAQLVGSSSPEAVLAPGSDRGNEVMAQLAARADLPLATNVIDAVRDGDWMLTRIRWGGSLLEHARMKAPAGLFTTALRSFEPGEPADRECPVVTFVPELDPVLARSRVVDRMAVGAGLTLATAPVVVSGGRGVGSADGFRVLEELAGLLGGMVGCSRVVTNNGWRPHTDQVGQTGTRVAPELYIACGISGAIQHWVGCMGAKHILAINTDPSAPLVAKADYAVIGDLHQVVPAVVDEVKRRRA